MILMASTCTFSDCNFRVDHITELGEHSAVQPHKKVQESVKEVGIVMVINVNRTMLSHNVLCDPSFSVKVTAVP